MPQLNYREYGEGFPVIILHGLLGMLDNWSSFAKDLSADYRVILADQRNHGRSPHSEEFSYGLLSADLAEFMYEMGLPQAHIIGHSMGGKTLMQFASEYPDKLRKGVVVDMAPKAYIGGHEDIFRALLDIELAEVQSRKDVQELLMSRLENLSVVLFLMKNLSRHPDGYYQWKANIPALYRNYQAILASLEPESPVSAELLFVRGGNSDYLLDEDIGPTRERFPNSRFVTVPDAGHWVHADNKEALLQIVREYLESGNS